MVKWFLVAVLGGALTFTSAAVCCIAVLANDVTVTIYSMLGIFVGLAIMLIADRIAQVRHARVLRIHQS